MKGSRTVLILAVGLIAGPRPLFPQDVGDRVRVTTGGGMVAGRIVGVSGDGFELGLSGGGSGSFTRADIVRLERSLGTSSAWKRASCTAARAERSWVYDREYADNRDLRRGDARDGYGGMLGRGVRRSPGQRRDLGALGGLLGLGVGALMRGPERWEDIALGGMEATFSPIFDLRLERGRPAAVLGARLRL